MWLLPEPRIMRFLSVCPNWGRVFVSDLDTVQHILARLAVNGTSVPGSRPS